MILVDTSIWINIFNLKHFAPLDLNKISIWATCPPVIQEVLQGINSDKAFNTIKEGLCALPCFNNPLSLDEYLLASDLYRLARKKGKTVRSSVDCLIAAIAIINDIPVWHKDRDFDVLAEISN